MKTRVLFLCSANSARSQMAEVLLRHFGGDDFEVFSAGTEPSEVDPRTVEALQVFGFEAQGLVSKSIESLGDQHFDYVISLCDKAHRECRYWPGSGVVMAWDFPDPKASSDPKAFARTLQEISERVRLFVLVNSKDVNSEVKVLQPLEFYKSLADETRLLSLLLIEQEGELCVCELMAALDLPQPKISRHLSQLRKAGLLLDRRQGQWVFYRLHPLLHDWMRDVLRQTREHSTPLLRLPLQRLEAMIERPSKGGNGCGTAVALKDS
jgi:ArsR family transcriptional regulator